MLNEKKFVIQSLELHLFFARIMKEHSLFLEAGFTPRDADFAKEADEHKIQFENILLHTVKAANGLISNNVLSSGEIITDFTLGAEQKTQGFTGIPINQNITIMQSRLRSSNHTSVSLQLINHVKQINECARESVCKLIAFKERVLHDVLTCKMFTVNYPLLIEHILREAKLYHSYIINIENGKGLDDEDIRQTELFWDQIMMEHALFIRGLLDPTEGELINTANNFAEDYAELIRRAQEAADITIAQVTRETLIETMKYKDFKQAGTKGISECKIRSIIVPLLADHVLRESNHFIRLLKNSVR